MRKAAQSGLTLPMVALLAVIMAIIIAEVSKIMKESSHEMVYFNAMNRAYRLAETGLNAALGQLSVDPKATFDGSWVYVSTESGCYQVLVTPSENPIPGGFYVVSSATRTLRGSPFSCKLHTYVSLSNIGDYFAAASTRLKVSRGMNAPAGKVYSPVLEFVTATPPAATTSLYMASFVTSCSPPVDPPMGYHWNASTKAIVVISSPIATNEPIKLAVPLIFPQVLAADITRYQGIAGPHAGLGTFTGEIYPPGFAEFNPGSPPPGDNYGVNHTTINAQHVYFFNGDMHIQGTIHGQILFVATGNIYITSNIQRFGGTAASDFPGYTYQSASSTAHQAVLITRGNIVIDNTFYTAGNNPVAYYTETIEAMLLCPNGDLSATAYPNGDLYGIHTHLRLDFTGAIIVGTWRDYWPSNFPSVFRDSRSYQYMTSLRDNPPPYLPALAEIKYSLEETTTDVGIY